MNAEINLLYDEYVPEHSFIETFDFWATHVYIKDAKCYVYKQCSRCKNIRVNQLISGIVYCDLNIKLERYRSCKYRVEI